MEDALQDALKPQIKAAFSDLSTLTIPPWDLQFQPCSCDLTNLQSVHTCQCFYQLSLSYTQYTICFQAKWHPALSLSPTLLSTYVVSINTQRCHQTCQLFIPTLFNLCIQVCFNCFCSLMFSKAFCIVLFVVMLVICWFLYSQCFIIVSAAIFMDCTRFVCLSSVHGRDTLWIVLLLLVNFDFDFDNIHRDNLDSILLVFCCYGDEMLLHRDFTVKWLGYVGIQQLRFHKMN